MRCSWTITFGNWIEKKKEIEKRIVKLSLHKTFARRWNLGVPTFWNVCFKFVNLCLHWLLFGDGDVIELVLFDRVDGDDSIFIDSDVVDVEGDCCCCCRIEWSIFVPLLIEFELVVGDSLFTDVYDWSLILLQAIDCVDGCVVRIVSFWETVDLLRWCRWIWCCIDGGVWTDEIGFSMEVLPVVNAAILEKTSFLVNVGDEHGLIDGVLLAEMVLLLKINHFIGILFSDKLHYLIFE